MRLNKVLKVQLLLLGLFLPWAAEAANPVVLLVVDSSKSMWGRIDNIEKVYLARQELADMVHHLPKGVDLGLIAYGHRHEGDCNDVEMLAPIGSSPDELIRKINSFTPKGKTSLTSALGFAIDHIKGSKRGGTIVLLTDGMENCKGDHCKMAKEAGSSIDVDVIGFGVNPSVAKDLSCVARNGGGLLFIANSKASLHDALQRVNAQVAASILFARDKEPVKLAVESGQQQDVGATPVMAEVVAATAVVGATAEKIVGKAAAEKAAAEKAEAEKAEAEKAEAEKAEAEKAEAEKAEAEKAEAEKAEAEEAEAEEEEAEKKAAFVDLWDRQAEGDEFGAIYEDDFADGYLSDRWRVKNPHPEFMSSDGHSVILMTKRSSLADDSVPNMLFLDRALPYERYAATLQLESEFSSGDTGRSKQYAGLMFYATPNDYLGLLISVDHQASFEKCGGSDCREAVNVVLQKVVNGASVIIGKPFWIAWQPPHSQASSTHFDVRLRIEKVGSYYTGLVTTDGEHWYEVGKVPFYGRELSPMIFTRSNSDYPYALIHLKHFLLKEIQAQ